MQLIGRHLRWRIANSTVPEEATTHDEARVRYHAAEARFCVYEMTFGNWCGRPSLLGHQNLIILTSFEEQGLRW